MTDATQRFFLNMFFPCLQGPTMKEVPAIDRIFPHEYISAKSRGLPATSSENRISDCGTRASVNVRAEGRAAHGSQGQGQGRAAGARTPKLSRKPSAQQIPNPQKRCQHTHGGEPRRRRASRRLQGREGERRRSQQTWRSPA